MYSSIIEQIHKLKQRFDTVDPYELIDGLKINLWFRNGLGCLKGFYCILNRQRYIVLNSDLNERDQLMVAAHELGHDCFHKELAKVSPLKDFMLYDMTSLAEYQANMFAAELLITDEEIGECIAEDMDYSSLCNTVGFNPQLVAFKLNGMVKRGYKLNLPSAPNSRFLGN